MMGVFTSIPAFVNAHTHSPFGPHFNGVLAAQPFESFMVDSSARYYAPTDASETAAFALVTGLENLLAGNTALVDQCFVPLNEEHLFAITRAYEDLRIKAWVFTELSDLPFAAYTREAYPRYPRAVPTRELPPELQAMCEAPPDYRDQLNQVSALIRKWRGKRVRIGLGLSNPVWCSDGLIRGAAALARELEVPITFHAEESPVQHEAHQAQWGMSAIERASKLGILHARSLVNHAVQVRPQDIAIMAKARCSVSHNPSSNLKLRNGVAPIGPMLAAGVNVCLGSDGHSSGDSQSLFPAMRLVSALAPLNGLDALPGRSEDLALAMAVEHGRRLGFEGDFSGDRIEFSSPIGPYAHVWDDPAPKIREVYVEGEPQLARARALVSARGAPEVVETWMARLADPECAARAEALATALAKGLAGAGIFDSTNPS